MTKKISTLLVLLCIYAYGFTQLNITINPLATAPVCPHPSYASATLSQPGVVLYTLQFPGTANNYEIITTAGSTAPVACKIVQNIPASSGNFADIYVAFEDQNSKAATFTVRNKTSGNTQTFTFAYIRSIKGLGPAIITNEPYPFNYPLCVSGTMLYNFTKNVRYVKADDHNEEFEGQIPLYEYSVPIGWKVAGQTSTGPNTYILAVPAAKIEYDAFHSGNVTIRATQKGGVCGNLQPTLAAGDEKLLAVNRPALSLTANGASSVSITCGTSVTQTFTLNNAPTNGCFSYEWDLGSDNNNWLYNGAPAPRIIPSSAHSITLTSAACAGKPSNVTLKVSTSNGASTTFTVPVIVHLPQLSIVGDERVCLGSEYRINNLPCPGGVIWTIDNPAIAELTVQGDVATLRALQNGFVELKAVVNNLCGSQPVTIKKERIAVGSVPTTIIGPFDPQTHNSVGAPCLNKVYYLEPSPITPGITYTWSVMAPDGSGYISNTSRITVPFFEWGCYTVQLTQRGGCISPSFSERILCTQECTSEFSASLSPNPSKDVLSITVHDPTKAREAVKIQLFDLNTGKKEKEWTYNDGQNKYQLNVKGLKRGAYVLTISKGKKQYSKQVILD